MKISSWAKYAVGVTVAAAMLAACSSGGNSSFGPSGVAPSGHQTGLTALSKVQDAALTMPHYLARPVHTDHGHSFMNPDAKKSGSLLYVGDWDTNDVYVYDYPSGKSEGTITGGSEPYGMCVDKGGDVYVAEFGSGDVLEYAKGSTKVKNTYSSGGEPIGCSVDTSGDVAVTSFSPGEVVLYAKGNPKSGKTYSDSSCEYLWTAGFDNAGNIMGVGEYSSITVCALLKGAKNMTTLTAPGTIDFPGGSSWDGKYIGIGDQEAGGTYETGDYPSTLSKTTLKSSGEIVFSDTCYSDYVDDVNPFFVGKSNEVGAGPIGDKKKKKGGQATAMVGPNLWCADAGTSKVDYWKYPAGGSPTGNLSSPPGAPYGAAVSI